jgi:hypothetical protein
MKRLYAKLAEESNVTLTGLLAAFLCGVLVAMGCHWLLF